MITEGFQLVGQIAAAALRSHTRSRHDISLKRLHVVVDPQETLEVFSLSLSVLPLCSFVFAVHVYLTTRSLSRLVSLKLFKLISLNLFLSRNVEGQLEFVVIHFP